MQTTWSGMAGVPTKLSTILTQVIIKRQQCSGIEAHSRERLCQVAVLGFHSAQHNYMISWHLARC